MFRHMYVNSLSCALWKDGDSYMYDKTERQAYNKFTHVSPNCLNSVVDIVHKHFPLS